MRAVGEHFTDTGTGSADRRRIVGASAVSRPWCVTASRARLHAGPALDRGSARAIRLTSPIPATLLKIPGAPGGAYVGVSVPGCTIPPRTRHPTAVCRRQAAVTKTATGMRRRAARASCRCGQRRHRRAPKLIPARRHGRSRQRYSRAGSAARHRRSTNHFQQNAYVHASDVVFRPTC